jgi:hypothetical protein
VKSKQLPDGSPADSFLMLLRNLASIVRSTCRSKDADAGTLTFIIDTQQTPNQKKASELLKEIKV